MSEKEIADELSQLDARVVLLLCARLIKEHSPYNWKELFNQLKEGNKNDTDD